MSSDHFDGRQYFNPPASGEANGFGAFLRWQQSRNRGAWRRWTPLGPVPFPAADIGGDDLRLTFVGHSTWLIQIGGLNILTDPVWSMRIGPRIATALRLGPRRHRPPALPIDFLPKIHAILLSHNHYDHLDRPTLRTLNRVHAPEIIAPPGVSRTVPAAARTRTRELDWWEACELGAIRITCAPARHFSARSLRDRNRSLWCGFVIQVAQSAPGQATNAWIPAVYFAGDTGWGEHFAEIRRHFPGIRIALLPIGAYLPRWFMAPVHLSPEEAVQAQQTLGAQVALAMHFGTFALADDGEDEPELALRQALAENPADFRMPEPGYGLSFKLNVTSEVTESTA